MQVYLELQVRLPPCRPLTSITDTVNYINPNHFFCLSLSFASRGSAQSLIDFYFGAVTGLHILVIN